jgi:hypothetical protein
MSNSGGKWMEAALLTDAEMADPGQWRYTDRPRNYAGAKRRSDSTWPGRRSVLVYVVAVLEVPVSVVDMVDMVAVLNGLASVVLGVRRTVIGVNLRLGVPLAVMDMVDMVAMHDGLVAVTWQMLMVARLDVFRGCHGSS